MNDQSFIGIIGLGVMGRNLALNILDNNYALSVYNRIAKDEEHIVTDFLKERDDKHALKGFTDLSTFISSLDKPRKILLMIKAGAAIDHLLANLLPHLETGDIVIDGGNSQYEDTIRREKFCQEKEINYVGMGVSGGEEGARFGPSMMVGGTAYSYSILSELFESIAAKDEKQQACCTHIGANGAGHFVKMVHNGIEYAEMQLLAELYALLKPCKSNEAIADMFEQWNSGDLSSYLLQCSVDILRHKTGENFTLDLILDKAANKGTGAWSVKAALDIGTVNTMMAAALFARYVSAQKKERLSIAAKRHVDFVKNNSLNPEILERAYTAARSINHHQGFELVKAASNQHDWAINLSALARIWTNGCIIRSSLMQQCVDIFKQTSSLLAHEATFMSIYNQEESLKALILFGVEHNVGLPCFQAAQTYWQMMNTARLPANLIQAQRDYFGAHTYQRTDQAEDQHFHTNWKKP